LKLEKSKIDTLTCPPDKADILVFDDELTGFGVRITCKGTKTFLFQYKRDGRVRRMTLGKYGDITPAQARKLAEAARGHVAAGNDPMGMKLATLAAEAAEREKLKRLAAANALTFEKLLAVWQQTALATASDAHCRDSKRTLRRHFAKLLNRPADGIQTSELQKIIDPIAADRLTSAKRSRTYGRAMYNWAVDRKMVAENPFEGVRIEGREISRDRFLSNIELGAIWRATGATGYPFGPLVRLLILTLARRSEIASMRWGEIDNDFTTWTLPASRAKNGRAHQVHLTEPARAILRELVTRPRKAGQTLVFSITGKTAVSGFSHAKYQIENLIAKEPPAPPGNEIPWQSPWTFHDFRRTGVTSLARLGVAPHVADRLLNHVGGAISGVMAVYQRHAFTAEREAALQLWAKHVIEVAEATAPHAAGELGDNVVRIPARRGRKMPKG